MKVALCVMTILGIMSSQALTADVSGKVAFEGSAPKPARIQMNADPQCARIHKTAVTGEEVVVNSNGTLKNVLVYVKEGLKSKKYNPPATKVVFDQQGCLYTPHVLGIQTGQELEILNSDPLIHNVHSLSKDNPPFNVAQPKKGMKLSKKFEKEELFKVKCEVHPWMGAYIGVFNHPFFAVTGDDGSFNMKKLPAGDYTLEAWHEKYGTQTMKVTVGATDKKTVDFKFVSK
jgi:plastocyanin